jgi:hypothetical protein
MQPKAHLWQGILALMILMTPESMGALAAKEAR